MNMLPLPGGRRPCPQVCRCLRLGMHIAAVLIRSCWPLVQSASGRSQHGGGRQHLRQQLPYANLCRFGNFSLSIPVDTALYHAMKTYLHRWVHSLATNALPDSPAVLVSHVDYCT